MCDSKMHCNRVLQGVRRTAAGQLGKHKTHARRGPPSASWLRRNKVHLAQAAAPTAACLTLKVRASGSTRPRAPASPSNSAYTRPSVSVKMTWVPARVVAEPASTRASTCVDEAREHSGWAAAAFERHGRKGDGRQQHLFLGRVVVMARGQSAEASVQCNTAHDPVELGCSSSPAASIMAAGKHPWHPHRGVIFYEDKVAHEVADDLQQSHICLSVRCRMTGAAAEGHELKVRAAPFLLALRGRPGRSHEPDGTEVSGSSRVTSRRRSLRRRSTTKSNLGLARRKASRLLQELPPPALWLSAVAAATARAAARSSRRRKLAMLTMRTLVQSSEVGERRGCAQK